MSEIPRRKPNRADEGFARLSLILGIDTADVVGSVALVADDDRVGFSTFQTPPTYAENLARKIAHLLEKADVAASDLAGVAVSSGPGSFTGLRIGISTALGITAALGIPIVGVETLPARAAAMGRRNELLCPVLNAGNGLIFFAFFQWEEAGPVRITEDSALEPEKFCQRIERPTLVWGGGAEHYHDILDAEAGRGLRLIPRGSGLRRRQRWPLPQSLGYEPGRAIRPPGFNPGTSVKLRLGYNGDGGMPGSVRRVFEK